MITKKKIFACICAGLIAISLMLPLPARAANSYYVSPSGNDSNPGTQTQPWKTIQKAANTLGAGDTAMVMAGDYPQRISITKSGSSSAPIIYRAQGQVTMKGFNVGASYVTIDGFEVSSTDYVSWNYSSSAGIYVTGNGNVIQNNYIHDATMSGIDVASGSGNTVINNRLYRDEMVGVEVHGSNNLVEGNEVWGTVQCPPAVTKVEGGCGSGLDADGMRYFGTGHIFRGNYIHDIPYGGYNVNPHIDCWQTFGGGTSNILFEQNRCINLQSQSVDENGTGWMIENASNITIRNNIVFTYAGVDGNLATVSNLNIYNNLFGNSLSFTRFNPKGIGLYNTAGVVIKNNIFYNQPSATIDGTSPGLVVDHNLSYRTAGSNSCNLGANSLCNVNPQFVDPASGDYNLKSTSPAIDAGYDLGSVVPNDFNGVSRPKGAGYDIGPYEGPSSSQPTPTPSPLPTMALLAPADGMTLLNNQPTFAWSIISDAVNYTIQISKNSTFTQSVTNAKVTPPNYTPSAFLPAGKTLYWRVRAKLAAGFSQWSATYSLHTAQPPIAPKLVKPVNNALITDYTPMLDWTDSSVPSGGATFDHYLLQVATDPAFTGATEISVSGLKNSQYTFPSSLDPNTKFYWRVSAYKTNGEFSSWSSVRNFRTAIQPPSLLKPKAGFSTNNHMPTFNWSDVKGASSYILQVSKSSTFSSSILKVTVTSVSYTPTITLPVGTLYWRVQAKGTNGPSLWSETRTLIEN